MNIGVALSGGGARAAYQAGVLKGIADLVWKDRRIPFCFITGASAGAINGAFLASYADDFKLATSRLWDLWEGLVPEDIYKTNVISLGAIGLRWAKSIGTGGVIHSSKPPHLLNTEPLGRLLRKQIDFDRIHANIEAGHIKGVVVSATNYLSGAAVSFYDSNESIASWQRSHRVAEHVRLQVDHVMASAAIPLFFPPVQVDGRWFGDGSIRAITPLSPAIHMGSDKVFAVGVKSLDRAEKVEALTQERRENISIAEIAGLLLNSIFLGVLERDVERMQRINRSIELMSGEDRARHPDRLRAIPVKGIRPSKDLGELTKTINMSFSPTLNFLFRGIGAAGAGGGEVLSYLAFQSAYTGPLLQLGYQDVLDNIDDLKKWFHT